MTITPRFNAMNDLLEALCIDIDSAAFERTIGAIEYNHHRFVSTHGMQFVIMRDNEGFYNLVVNVKR